MTIPPFLQLEIQISDSFVNAHKKSNKEIRYELRNENRNVLKNKIEKLLKKPQINKQKMDNTAEKTEFDEVKTFDLI